MEVVGSEVGVRGVVQVVAGDLGVAEDDRTTAVGLQAVLVRVDDDGVGVGDRGVGRGDDPVGGVVGDESEEAAVGGIDVHACAVLAAERDDLVNWVDGAEARSASGGNDCADAAGSEAVLEGVEVHGAGVRRVDDDRLDAEQVAHACVGVVGVGAVRDRLAGVRLAGDEESLKVGDGAAAGEVAQVAGEPEHGGQVSDHLLLERRRGGAAVEGVVVGVDQHRAEVADDRGGVGRLEHLADVAGVEERVVVPQPVLQVLGGHEQLVHGHVHGRVRLEGTVLTHPRPDRGDARAEQVGQVGQPCRAGVQDALTCDGRCQSRVHGFLVPSVTDDPPQDSYRIIRMTL